VTFLVYGDGKLLAQSKPLRAGEAAQELSADTGGAKIVELVARADGSAPLSVDWGEAALVR
jgi:alpha-galactosidase